jgi:hypothetical protein
MKIYCLKNGDLCYYGKTHQSLAQRKAEHNYAYKSSNRKISSSLIFSLAESTNTKVEIELIEEVQGTKKDLDERERYYISNNECVNVLFNKKNNKKVLP